MRVNSILYKEIEQKEAIEGRLGDRTVYHLSFDRCFSCICPDRKRLDYFLDVISKPLKKREDIVYRQDILKDLVSSPSLFRELDDAYRQYEEFGREAAQIKKDLLRTKGHGKQMLQESARFLSKNLEFVKRLDGIFSRNICHSEGLQNIKRSANALVSSPEYEKMLEICAFFGHFSVNGNEDFYVTLNEKGQIERVEYIDRITVSDNRSWLSKISKKSPSQVLRYNSFSPPPRPIYAQIGSAPLAEISDLFARFTEQIDKAFGMIGKELAFYSVSLLYIDFLRRTGAEYTYPNAVPTGELSFENLQDLLLLTEYEDAQRVVPNSLMDSEGIKNVLLFGDNGSGKTVFLRSLSTLQVLAQSGLPVTAKSATVGISGFIMTQFSESEKEFECGNEAGRFEQEVRELAAVIDVLDENSVVFLNETFQSTSYDEGAEGLADILAYFDRKSIRWVLVSHLLQLDRLLPYDNVARLRTAEGYKIVLTNR